MSYNNTESWFNDVTGTNDYERQSWRDSSNGGRAAGDWTGNVNARLDAERASFQGATWSGSSSQPSAIQVAQQGGRYTAEQLNYARVKGIHIPGVTDVKPSVPSGPGVAGVPPPAAAPVPSGPSSTGVIARPAFSGSGVPANVPRPPGPGGVVPRPAAGRGPSSPGVGVSNTTGPGIGSVNFGDIRLAPHLEDKSTGGAVGGFHWEAAPGWSNVEDFWEARYGEPGEWIGGILTMPVDAWHNAGRFVDYVKTDEGTEWLNDVLETRLW